MYKRLPKKIVQALDITTMKLDQEGMQILTKNLNDNVFDTIYNPDAPEGKQVTHKLKDIRRFRRLVKRMYRLMVEAGGVGLAAPQIGINRKLAIVHPSFIPDPSLKSLKILIHPSYTPVGEEYWTSDEGCLSINKGNYYDAKKRYLKIKVINWVLQADGTLVTEYFVVSGFLARIIQHEVDHLNNKLFLNPENLIKKK